MSSKSPESVSIARTSDQDSMRELAFNRTPFIYSGKQSLALDEFLESYGDQEVQVSKEEFSLPTITGRTSLRSYFEKTNAEPRHQLDSDQQKQAYVFHDVLKEEGGVLSKFVNETELPEFFIELSNLFRHSAVRLAFGPHGSYANLHTHGIAINQLLCGKKRWRLIHPYVTNVIPMMLQEINVPNKYHFYETQIAPIAHEHSGDIASLLREKFYDWHKQGLCERFFFLEPVWHTPIIAEYLRGITFYQEPGELVFIPANWGHAIQNYEWTLARVFQLEEAAVPAMTRNYCRYLDEKKASIRLTGEVRIVMQKVAKLYLDDVPFTEANKLLIEILRSIDNHRSAEEVAALTSSPVQAANLLQELQGSLFVRVLGEEESE